MQRTRMIAVLVTGLCFAACGGGNDGGSTADASANGSGDGGAGGADAASTPPAPVVTNLDCAKLPEALEGDDPLATQFYFTLNGDLSCTYPAPGVIDTGILMMLEFYDEPQNNISENNLRFGPMGNNPVQWTVTGCSAGTEVHGQGNALIGYSDLPRGEDVTLTLKDYPDQTRTLELVFQISPPWVALQSLTEL